MKHRLQTFLLLAALSTACALHAQVIPTIQWQQSLGGNGIDFAQSIQQTTDGGYIVAGQSGSTDGDVTGNHGNNDYWIVRLDTAGGLVWQKSLGGSDNDLGNSIQQTTDGGFIVAGNCRSTDGDVTGNHGLNDYWVVKLDASGVISWQKSLGGTGVDIAHSVEQTSDGGYIVSGISNSTDGDVSGNHGGFDYWVVKLNSDGSLDWQKTLGGSDYDEGFSAKQTSDGGYIVAGASASTNGNVTGNHGALDYWIVKLDADGNLVWQKALGGNSDDGASSAEETTDGGFIVEGYTNSNNGNVTGNHGGGDYWIVKLDATGNIVWKKCLGGTLLDYASSVQQSLGDGYIVAGYSSSTNGDVTVNHGSSDYWLVKLDESGALVWQKSLGGTTSETSSGVQQTADGGFVVTGSSNSNNGDVSGNHGFEDYWVVKLTTDGITGIPSLSNSFISIYPNPATTQLYIHFTTLFEGSCSQDEEVTVLNILGEQVMKETASSQSDNITLDISALPSGAYIIQLATVKEIIRAKFVKE